VRPLFAAILSVLRAVVTAILLAVLAVYRAVISPVLHALFPGGGCGYEPSCSVYAVESIRLNGPFVGGLQAVRRILRCHPFHPGGYDPPVRKR